MSRVKAGESSLSNLNIPKIHLLLDKVNANSAYTNEIADLIIKEYCVDLDVMMLGLRKRLTDPENPFTIPELNEIIIQIPIYLHYVIEGVERVGMKLDIMTEIKKEIFHQSHLNAEGTVEIKRSIAEQASKQETVVQSIYDRAYKQIKNKLTNAYELLNSAKKLASLESTKYELSKGAISERR